MDDIERGATTLFSPSSQLARRTSNARSVTGARAARRGRPRGCLSTWRARCRRMACPSLRSDRPQEAATNTLAEAGLAVSQCATRRRSAALRVAANRPQPAAAAAWLLEQPAKHDLLEHRREDERSEQARSRHQARPTRGPRRTTPSSARTCSSPRSARPSAKVRRGRPCRRAARVVHSSARSAAGRRGSSAQPARDAHPRPARNDVPRRASQRSGRVHSGRHADGRRAADRGAAPPADQVRPPRARAAGAGAAHQHHGARRRPPRRRHECLVHPHGPRRRMTNSRRADAEHESAPRAGAHASQQRRRPRARGGQRSPRAPRSRPRARPGAAAVGRGTAGLDIPGGRVAQARGSRAVERRVEIGRREPRRPTPCRRGRASGSTPSPAPRRCRRPVCRRATRSPHTHAGLALGDDVGELLVPPIASSSSCGHRSRSSLEAPLPGRGARERVSRSIVRSTRSAPAARRADRRCCPDGCRQMICTASATNAQQAGGDTGHERARPAAAACGAGHHGVGERGMASRRYSARSASP